MLERGLERGKEWKGEREVSKVEEVLRGGGESQNWQKMS